MSRRDAGATVESRRDPDWNLAIMNLRAFPQYVLQDAMHDQVGIAADWRREVRVTGCGQREVAQVFFRVARLLKRPQHQVAQDALLRFAGDLGGQLLVHTWSDVHVFWYFNRAHLLAGAARGPAVGLELHPVNGQRSHSERISERRGNHFEIVDA